MVCLNESSQKSVLSVLANIGFDLWYLLILLLYVLFATLRVIVKILIFIVIFPVYLILYLTEDRDYIIPMRSAMEDDEIILSDNGFIAFFQKLVIAYRKFVSFLYEKFPRTAERLDAFFGGDGDRAQNNRVFYFFLAPALFSFVLMVFVPFFTGIYYSLTDFRGVGTPDYVGFENYQEIFSDMTYYYSFYRTAIYSILNIIAINIVAFGLAILVTQKLKLRNLFRAGFFMPNLIGGLVLGYIFQFVYSQVFTAIGESWLIDFVNRQLGTGILQDNLLTSGASNAMIAIIIVVTWQYAGYIMMIYIAAIQNIPQSLVEAAKIDGANALQRLRNITLPLVAQAFTVAMFLTLVTSFKQFDTVFSMTSGGPTDIVPGWVANITGGNPLAPVATLDFMAINIYDTAFADQMFGFGQAKAIIFFAILLVISLLQVYFNKKREVEL